MAAPVRESQTAVQTGAAQTMAVNMPSSVAAGDLILVWLFHTGTIGAMPGSPDAFTSRTTTVTNQHLAWLRGQDHIDNGSPASYTFTTSVASAISNAIAFRISGILASGDPIDAHHSGFNGPGTLSFSATVTTTVVDTLLINLDRKSVSDTWASGPTGLTLDTAATGFFHTFSGSQAAIGSSGAKQSTYGGSTNHNSLLVAIKPLTGNTLPDVILGGSKKVGSTGSVILAGAKKAVASQSSILGGTKKVNT